MIVLAVQEGITMAGVVRRILDKALGLSEDGLTVDEALELSAGLWADRSEEEIRGLRELRSLDRQES